MLPKYQVLDKARCGPYNCREGTLTNDEAT